MKTTIRILSIDGGGVRGIMPARLLEQLHAADSRIIDRADLVAGTSTGGLIALGLGCGKTPAELCDIYLDQAKDIFSKANRRYLAVRLFRAKFDPVGLRRAVEAIAGQLTLGELTAKSVVIPVTAIQRADKSHRPAGIFLSTAYRLSGDQAHERFASSHWKCVDAALATAAAPTYFPAHEVTNPDSQIGGKWVCWDGGIVANNPGLAAVAEIYRLDLAVRNIKTRGHPAEAPDIRVLSLGTGYGNIDITGGDWGLIQSARPVVKALMDASVGSTAYLLRQILGTRAIRVSVPVEANYEMDDPSTMDSLNSIALDFAQHGFGSVRQPDGTDVDLKKWLADYWFDQQ